MKKAALALAMAGALTFGFGVAADAYPPSTSTAPPTTPAPTTVPAPTTSDAGAGPGTGPTTSAAGGLPATGSSGIDTTTSIALGLIVLGGGLSVVSIVRRRQGLTS